MPDLDDESVVASKVFVDKRRKEVGGVKRRIVVDVVKLEVEKTFVVRRVVAEVVLVADDVAPLLGEKPRPVAPVLEDHPIRRKNSAIIFFYFGFRSYLCLGCRHRSVDSSAITILPPWVRIPSRPSMLFIYSQISAIFVFALLKE